MFTIDYSPKARRQLKKLDPYIANLIYDWIEENLEGCYDPRSRGKAMVGDMAGYWRYRVGKYRIIAEIYDGTLLIQIVEIDHRRQIYLEHIEEEKSCQTPKCLKKKWAKPLQASKET